jgi:hypothetical protein
MSRNGNSRKDPVLAAGAEEMRRLLEVATAATDLALEEFERSPRWNGLPGADYGGAHLYPYDYVLLRAHGSGDDLDNPSDSVKDEASGIEYHRQVIARLATRLRQHLPRSNYEVDEGRDTETPRGYLDRIRGILRWGYRLDSSSLVTNTLALLKCVKKGRPKPSTGADNRPSLFQDYTYIAIPRTDMLMLPEAMSVADAIRDAFEHADRMLLPRDPTPRELEFLRWMRDRGGFTRVKDLIRWIDEDKSRGSTSDGQGTEGKLLRRFCEKDAPKGARVVWRLRKGALDLIP